MCGRYRRTTREEEIARIYHIPIPAQPDLPISYNIAPNQPVLAIRFNADTKQRSLDTLLWGLVPYWSKDDKTGFINARAERIDTAPAFRRPFQKRRCLIPADGFYEWKKTPEGKIPYSIEMKDGSPFVFAGLWDGWQNPGTKEWLRTCVIIRVNQTSWSPKYIPGCLSFCRRRRTSNGFQASPEKKSCDRSLPKK
jgi:putative SOS response-associated peptidase YedK